MTIRSVYAMEGAISRYWPTYVGADVDLSHRADLPVSHLPRTFLQSLCGIPPDRLGPSSGRHPGRKWLTLALATTVGVEPNRKPNFRAPYGPSTARFSKRVNGVAHLRAAAPRAVEHFCSWLGLFPGTKISGGKVLSAGTTRSANRARQALKLAAMSLSRSDSALGAVYRRLCSRMDKPRANAAVAHKLARMVYFMLTSGEEYVDQGRERYEEQQRQRSVAALKRRAATLGFLVAPIAATS